MQITTKAIVISSLKYGDTSLIVKCYTEEAGLKSYLLKGVLKSKKGKLKVAYFQPLSQLILEANHKNKGTLESIREVKTAYAYKTVHTDIKKGAIAMFLSEMLNVSIVEEEVNQSLFEYLEMAFQWLDAHDQVANFHMLFLLNLTRYLGFYPDTNDAELPAFSLLDGAFTSSAFELHTISDKNLTLFKRLLGTTFDALNATRFSSTDRQQLLTILIEYFELHLQGFRKPRSLAVLNEVFN
ncbi:DNA repair protein RecO [Spongiivirga sp. MCCC 1A20706]|uniref:DNA repair protein RecO n=1 Tax=Spongiivirga sp. MCCC 1A20706 TaxID=3160963 RepID=UPI003977600E